MITVEDLLRSINKVVDLESGYNFDSSKWDFWHYLCLKLGTQEIYSV